MKLKPFTSIPGPKVFPLIGSLHRYLPIIGDYSFSRLHRAGLAKYEEYGPLVRECYPGGVNLLNIFDPDDMAVVFANETPLPYRRSHLAVEKYRLDRPHMYSCGGLLPSNGEDWWRLRKEAQKVMNRIHSVRTHLKVIDEISTDFVNFVKYSINPETNEIENFLPLLKKAFFEMTIATNLDTRFGSLDVTKPMNEEDFKFMEASSLSNQNIIATDNGLRLWRWFDTRIYRDVCEGQDIIYRSALKILESKEKNLLEKRKQLSNSDGMTEAEEHSLTTLEFSYLRTNLTKIDIMTIISDAILGGSDTSTIAVGTIMHQLAQNPDKQDKLAEEARTLLNGSGHKVTTDVLDKARYVKATVKEGLRLNPTSLGIGRIAKHDFNLRGYHVPKGTVLVTQHQVACRLKKYFSEPNQFIPERWLDRKAQSTYPYLFIPFGHGPRMCVGRRVAEQNIYTILLQLLNEFHIEWRGASNLDCITSLLNEPDSELKFKFTPRKNK